MSLRDAVVCGMGRERTYSCTRAPKRGPRQTIQSDHCESIDRQSKERRHKIAGDEDTHEASTVVGIQVDP